MDSTYAEKKVKCDNVLVESKTKRWAQHESHDDKPTSYISQSSSKPSKSGMDNSLGESKQKQLTQPSKNEKHKPFGAYGSSSVNNFSESLESSTQSGKPYWNSSAVYVKTLQSSPKAVFQSGSAPAKTTGDFVGDAEACRLGKPYMQTSPRSAKPTAGYSDDFPKQRQGAIEIKSVEGKAFMESSPLTVKTNVDGNASKYSPMSLKSGDGFFDPLKPSSQPSRGHIQTSPSSKGYLQTSPSSKGYLQTSPSSSSKTSDGFFNFAMPSGNVSKSYSQSSPTASAKSSESFHDAGKSSGQVIKSYARDSPTASAKSGEGFFDSGRPSVPIAPSSPTASAKSRDSFLDGKLQDANKEIQSLRDRLEKASAVIREKEDEASRRGKYTARIYEQSKEYERLLGEERKSHSRKQTKLIGWTSVLAVWTATLTMQSVPDFSTVIFPPSPISFLNLPDGLAENIHQDIPDALDDGSIQSTFHAHYSLALALTLENAAKSLAIILGGTKSDASFDPPAYHPSEISSGSVLENDVNTLEEHHEPVCGSTDNQVCENDLSMCSESLGESIDSHPDPISEQIEDSMDFCLWYPNKIIEEIMKMGGSGPASAKKDEGKLLAISTIISKIIFAAYWTFGLYLIRSVFGPKKQEEARSDRTYNSNASGEGADKNGKAVSTVSADPKVEDSAHGSTIKNPPTFTNLHAALDTANNISKDIYFGGLNLSQAFVSVTTITATHRLLNKNSVEIKTKSLSTPSVGTDRTPCVREIPAPIGCKQSRPLNICEGSTSHVREGCDHQTLAAPDMMSATEGNERKTRTADAQANFNFKDELTAILKWNAVKIISQQPIWWTSILVIWTAILLVQFFWVVW